FEPVGVPGLVGVIGRAEARLAPQEPARGLVATPAIVDDVGGCQASTVDRLDLPDVRGHVAEANEVCSPFRNARPGTGLVGVFLARSGNATFVCERGIEVLLDLRVGHTANPRELVPLLVDIFERLGTI